ncbi:HAD family hydrolase [Streptomyces justiciae]|uniref:HAD family hydrolase n=1 Tax=Streptomyces justiciae TaxID=2780140 RepID=UPI00188215A0|nr:HAD family hydrolase [Streptomyces justiciae]MBE8477507.1 HAD family hydrolase [Streptomyces justiciae]
MLSNPPLPGSESCPELMLFDLDGVLMDSLPAMRAAWEAVTAELGVPVPFAAYAQHLGRPFGDILALFDLGKGEEGGAGFAEAYESAAVRFAHLARPFPGVEQALQDIVAADCRLGVVTSKSAARAQPMLAVLGAPFAVLRTPDQGRGKPSPDTLLLALVEAATDPADALYVGDMPVDQEAAQRAGLRYAHAAWGYGAPTKPLPLILQEPSQLVDLARGLPSRGTA